MKTRLMSAVVIAASLGATAATACTPLRPMTLQEQQAATLQRQETALDVATLIVEYEVVRAWNVRPPQARPPYDGDTHVELRPVRTLRGDSAQASVELVHQRFCGARVSYSSEPGTRLLAYSRGEEIADLSDIIDLIAVEEIAHAATLEILDTP
ncbi:MAG: hypothetical protein J0L52_07200 [Caulobacterales bacterium]|nr:hypothetical protein [Caulobacterales bacterium]